MDLRGLMGAIVLKVFDFCFRFLKRFPYGRVVLYNAFMFFRSPKPGKIPGQKSDQKSGQQSRATAG